MKNRFCLWLILLSGTLALGTCDINLLMSQSNQVCVATELIGAKNMSCTWSFDSSNLALINPDSTICWSNEYGQVVRVSHGSPILKGQSYERYYTGQHTVSFRTNKRCSSSGNCPSDASGYTAVNQAFNCQGNCDSSWTGKYLSFEQRRKDCSGGLATCSGCASSKCQWCSMNVYPIGNLFRVDKFKWIFDATQKVTVCTQACKTCNFAPGVECNGIVFTNLVAPLPQIPVFDKCDMILEYSNLERIVRFDSANSIGERDRSKVGLLKYQSVSDSNANAKRSDSSLNYRNGLYEDLSAWDLMLSNTLGFYDCNNNQAHPLLERAALRYNLSDCSKLKASIIDGPTIQITPHLKITPESSVALGFFSKSVITHSIIITAQITKCDISCSGIRLIQGGIECKALYDNSGSTGNVVVRSVNDTALSTTIMLNLMNTTTFEWTVNQEFDLEIVLFLTVIKCETQWDLTDYLQTMKPEPTPARALVEEGKDDESSFLDITEWPNMAWYDVGTGVLAYLFFVFALGALIFVTIKIVLPMYHYSLERGVKGQSRSRRGHQTVELSKMELNDALKIAQDVSL